MADYITEEQAAQCLLLVRAYLGEDADPKLYKPWHEGPYWNISYEGGPEEWAYDISHLRFEEFAKIGVFVEPVAMWCLALHPA